MDVSGSSMGTDSSSKPISLKCFGVMTDKANVSPTASWNPGLMYKLCYFKFVMLNIFNFKFTWIGSFTINVRLIFVQQLVLNMSHLVLLD